MKSAKFRLYLYLLAIASGFYSISANAQLDSFVNDADNGASDLQRATGIAIQRTCGALAAEGGFQLTGEQGDLFERCNEMVSTAAELQGDTGRTRSLMLSGPELLAAIQNVSGEELHAQNTLSTRVTNGQFSNIAGRLNAVRIGGSSAALGGRVAATGTHDDPSRNAPGYRDLSLGSRVMTGGAAAGDDDMAGSRWGWFLEGSFNTGDRDQTASEDGFDFDATSFTLGIDYLLDSGVIGASIGIDNYEADFNPTTLVSGGNVEVEGTTGAIFGAFFRDSWYVDGILSFGSLDSDTNRDAFYISNNPACLPAPCPGVNTTLSGETDGDFVAGGLSVGYDYTNGNWDITPQLSLAYRDVSLDGYVESDSLGGGLSLAYDEQQIDSLKSILGVAFTGNFSRDFGILSPQFRLEWHHEFEDDPARLLAKYAVENQLAAQGVQGAAGAGVFSVNPANCISCFQITGDEIDTDFGVISAGVSAVFSQRIQLYGVVDSLVGLDHLSSTGISVGIRGQF